MALLQDILYRVGIQEVSGGTRQEVTAVEFDSRRVSEGALFIAIKGTQSDGHEYMSKAIEKGATAIVCEKFPDKLTDGISYVRVENSAEALGWISSNFYENPSEKIKLIGITGTNGKTTTVTLLYKLFRLLKKKTGLISTISNYIDDKQIPATHTTPDPVTINSLLKQMVDAGCEYCFMEVSSHAVVQHRITGLNFTGGIFSNITHEHLDYHGTFQAYIEAKKAFFDKLGKHAFALINKDDKRHKVMVQNTSAKKYTYSLKGSADFNAKILENSFSGLFLNINGHEVYTRLIGEFNSYNILAVYATCELSGIDPLETLKAISVLQPAEGRFDYFISEKEKIAVVIDYAHSPDALEKVLQTISELRTGNENLITVVGCGGNRDQAKRPKMGRIAAEFSDKVILTSDNPRNEDPELIIQEMTKDILPPLNRKVISITGRKDAIHTACMMAENKDIILVAGKGHEKYQEIRGEKFPFDDKAILQEALKKMDK